MFGDYYYNAVGDPHHGYYAAGTDSGKANIDATAKPITKDLNGFQIRRLYFQLDNDLSIKYSSRFRLEVDSKSLTTDGKISVAVKGAYLQVRNVYPRGDFFFGILTTPIYEYVEDFWQYRSIEKTIADFRGIGSSADIGAELKGFLDPGHRFGYSAMLGNGLGPFLQAPPEGFAVAESAAFALADAVTIVSGGTSIDPLYAGVAAGLGEYFDVDPVLFRVGFVVAALVGGAGILAYGLAWLLLRQSPTGSRS